MMRRHADTLETHRLRLADALSLTADACHPVLDDLAYRYSSPERNYHNLDHVRAVLNVIQALAGPAPSPALLVAAWFHDAVYDPRAKDNEERSADLTRTDLGPLGTQEGVLTEAGRLILLTKTHRCSVDDRDGQVMLDADLAILGADRSNYDAYARAIRREYAWVPDDEYRKGRRRVLESFLGRDRIYRTDELHRAAEEQARGNLRREIDGLERGAEVLR